MGKGNFLYTQSTVSALAPLRVQLSSERKMLKGRALKVQEWRGRSPFHISHFRSAHSKSTLPSSLRPQGGSHKQELADCFLGWSRELHTGSQGSLSFSYLFHNLPICSQGLHCSFILHRDSHNWAFSMRGQKRKQDRQHPPVAGKGWMSSWVRSARARLVHLLELWP